MYRIFLVEDDAALSGTIQKQLEGWGYAVTVVKDFSKVAEEFSVCAPHLVILDIMLPFYNGFHWCAEIRRQSSVPILFLSSASDNMNIVMAINRGGDDFIAKPVDAMVLTAKIQAILRRTYELPDRMPVMAFHGAILRLNDGVVDFNGQEIELTKNEFRILRTLLEHKKSIVSREELMIQLWQDDCYVEENTLTVNVARLRKKLEQAGIENCIITRPGNGYIIP